MQVAAKDMADKLELPQLSAENAPNLIPDESNLMATFISLLKFTEQGAKNIKKSTNRAHTFDKLAEKSGVRIEGQYWTLGAYDGVLIISADSEEKALRCLLDLASQGNVRTETMQAFNDKGFDGIVGG